ncbi:MAG TPA: hypothetical protein VEK14_01530 [Rhodomicrobium sp.]|nr:hypothetical protein [Rhodomicrobium sp.]
MMQPIPAPLAAQRIIACRRGSREAFSRAALNLIAPGGAGGAGAFFGTRQFLGSGRLGGYQYSRSFLDRLWHGACPPQDNVSLLNFFQLYPDEIMNRPRMNRWFYIDQTLDQLFNYYGIASLVPKAARKDAMAREKDQYEASNGVICHTRWAAASVVET